MTRLDSDCEACGHPAECRVWEHAVCRPCLTAYGDELPGYPALDAMRVPDWDTAGFYRRYTAAWVELRRARFTLAAKTEAA